MSDLPVEGTLARPVRLDPFQRIIQVHFGAPVGVLEIDFPKGQRFEFDPANVDLPLSKLGPKNLDFGDDPVINKARLKDQNILINVLRRGGFSEGVYTETIRTIYESETPVYTVVAFQAISLPDDQIRDFPEEMAALLAAAYADAAASAPGFNDIHCDGMRVSYSPLDPTTAGTAAFCDPAKPAPGAQYYEWWKLITESLEGAKVYVRAVWVIDFSKWPASQGAKPITIKNIDPIADPLFGVLNTKIILKLYSDSTKLTVVSLGEITADKEPTYSKTLNVPYLQPVLAKFNKSGFVT